MTPLAEKLASLAREIEAEKGPVALFALFLREDAPGVWDLVVSAPWFEADKMEGFKYLSERIVSRLDPQEVLALSRVVPIDAANPGLSALRREVRVKKRGITELVDRVFFGLPIRHAYIFVLRDLTKRSRKSHTAAPRGK